MACDHNGTRIVADLTTVRLDAAVAALHSQLAEMCPRLRRETTDKWNTPSSGHVSLCMQIAEAAHQGGTSPISGRTWLDGT